MDIDLDLGSKEGTSKDQPEELPSEKEINIGILHGFGPDPIKDFHLLPWHLLMKFWIIGSMDEEWNVNVLQGNGDQSSGNKMAFSGTEYNPCFSCLDVRCKNQGVIKASSLSVMQRGNHFWKAIQPYYLRQWSEVNHLWRCYSSALEASLNPVGQLKLCQICPDLKKSACPKKVTYRSERAAERKNEVIADRVTTMMGWSWKRQLDNVCIGGDLSKAEYWYFPGTHTQNSVCSSEDLH